LRSQLVWRITVWGVQTAVCVRVHTSGGSIDAVVQMMIEMEFVTHPYSEVFDQIVDEFERVHCETHLDRRDVGVSSAGTGMRYPRKPRTWLLMRT
jgi:hypothetical protein